MLWGYAGVTLLGINHNYFIGVYNMKKPTIPAIEQLRKAAKSADFLSSEGIDQIRLISRLVIEVWEWKLNHEETRKPATSDFEIRRRKQELDDFKSIIESAEWMLNLPKEKRKIIAQAMQRRINEKNSKEKLESRTTIQFPVTKKLPSDCCEK
jgi:hypothetical protein